MPIWTILTLAAALSMDAFAVAVAYGVSQARISGRQTFRLSWHFGLFQAVMPVIGWSLGATFRRWIESSDHWVAFGFLAFVGVHMIIGGLRTSDNVIVKKDITRGFSLIMLSVATSIDAMAVGLSLSVLNVSIWFPAAVIGIVTGAITMIACQSGRVFKGSRRLSEYAEILGGLVLIGIGLDILHSHGVF